MEHVPTVTRDPDGNHVLAAAVAGDTAYVITRDRDLLSVGRYDGIKMLDPDPALEKRRGG